MPVDTQDLLNRWNALKAEREASIEAKAKEVAEYLIPDRGRFPGDERKPDKAHGKRGSKILDSTPGDAHEIATNGMYSGLTPPSRPWHRTQFQDEDLNEWGPAKKFMDRLERRRNAELRKSNFYSAMHSSYAESIGFANTLVYLRELDEGGFVFRTFTFGEYWWSRSATGRVDTVYRTEWMSAKKMLDDFGEDKCSRQVKESLRNNRPFDCYEILHAVEPRTVRDVTKKDAANKPFQSIWMETGNEKKVLREGGFDDFPYACAVWLLVGADNYGSGSPGFRKLPDIKQLQDMEESCLMAVHRELDPPIQAPPSMKGQPIRRNSGGITYHDGQADGLKRLYEFKFDIQAGEMKSEAIRQRIFKGFYNDLFLMITNSEARGQPVTATQILEMQGEKMLQLGPFIERQEDELLDPIVTFVTSRMLQRPWVYGLPMPPEEIYGQQYKIEYISLLAQAQRMIGIRAIDDTLTFATAGAQVNPEILDVYDLDEFARERADLVGLPAKLVRSGDRVAELREQRALQIQEQQAVEQAGALAAGAKTLGDAKLNPDDPSVLSEMMKGLGGEAVQ
jgi:hypothetical protein